MVARADEHDIADRHACHRRFAHRTVRQAQQSALRTQRRQLADGFAGAALGARLQILAEQHQRDDGGRRLEVQLAVRRLAQGKQQVPTVEVGRAGAQDHQHVHVGGAAPQGRCRGAVEPRAEHELHRRRQQHLRRWHQVQIFVAEKVEDHSGDHRNGQQRGDDHGAAFDFPALGIGGFQRRRRRRSGRRLRQQPVASFGSPLRQTLRRDLPQGRDGGTFEGQIDVDFHHARLCRQRLLHARRAGAARHALHGEGVFLRRHCVASLGDALHEGGWAGSLGRHHRGRFQR